MDGSVSDGNGRKVAKKLRTELTQDLIFINLFLLHLSPSEQKREWALSPILARKASSPVECGPLNRSFFALVFLYGSFDLFNITLLVPAVCRPVCWHQLEVNSPIR
jgi:hypothetical protein